MGSCLGLMGSALLTVQGPYGALLRCVALVWGSATRLSEWDASVLPVGSGVISGVMPVAFCRKKIWSTRGRPAGEGVSGGVLALIGS